MVLRLKSRSITCFAIAVGSYGLLLWYFSAYRDGLTAFKRVNPLNTRYIQTVECKERSQPHSEAGCKESYKFGMEPVPKIPDHIRVPPKDAYGSNLVQEGLSSLLDSVLGLEFGPLVAPSLRPDHPNSRFIDHLGYDALKDKFRGNPNVSPKLDLLPKIDYIWNGSKLSDVVGGVEKFGLVVANHVIEHVPDVITWLQDASSVLSPGGQLRLTIPDKRYCFDFRRPLTTFHDLVGRHVQKLKKPRPADVYAHFQLTAPSMNNPFIHWEAEASNSLYGRWNYTEENHAVALRASHEALHSYQDVHMSQWTPETFVEHLRLMHRFGFLRDLRIVKLQYTMRNDFQFYAILQKLR